MTTTPQIRGNEGADARGMAVHAAEDVKEKAHDAKRQAAEQARSQVDSRSTQLGEQIGSFGEALRKAAEQLGNEGKDGGASAASKTADQVERLAGYLSDSDSDRFLGDAERFGRQRPWVAGGIGAALGFVASRFLKASSERRYESARQARLDADTALTRDPSFRDR